MAKQTKAQKQEIEEAKQFLKEQITGKPEIYTFLRHVSRSGMRREISLHVSHDGVMQNLTYSASLVYGARVGNNGGVKVDGCGMDMGFHLVDYIMRSIGVDWDQRSPRHRWL